MLLTRVLFTHEILKNDHALIFICSGRRLYVNSLVDLSRRYVRCIKRTTTTTMRLRVQLVTRYEMIWRCLGQTLRSFFLQGKSFWQESNCNWPSCLWLGPLETYYDQRWAVRDCGCFCLQKGFPTGKMEVSCAYCGGFDHPLQIDPVAAGTSASFFARLCNKTFNLRGIF